MFARLGWLLAGTLRRQLIVGMVLVVASMMSVFVWDSIRRQQADMMEDQSVEALALVGSLATSSSVWVASRDLSGVQEIVEGLARYPGMRYVIVLDLRGQIMAHSDVSRRGLYMTDLPQKSEPRFLQQGEHVVDIVAPILLSGHQLGWARIGFSSDVHDAALASIARNGIVYALIAIALSALLAWLASRYMTRRLYAIQRVADAVQAGESGLRVHITADDEAAQLARQFNRMLDTLALRKDAMEEALSRLQMITNRVPGVIVFQFRLRADGSSCVPYASEALRDIYRISPDEVLDDASPLFAVVQPDDLLIQLASIKASARDLTPWIGEYRLKFGAEQDVWLAVNAMPQREAAGSVRWYGFITDITERKQAEEAQRLAAAQLAEKVEELQRMQTRLIETERLRAMGQMAAGVAHDFNNALMGVLGQAQLMQLALEREPGAVAVSTFLLECLARQEQATQDAAETVRKIRGATRPRDTEAFGPVALGEIVEQVLAITQPRWKDQAEAAGVLFTVHAALPETPPVLGHAAELREALTNLFFNALDAMPQGGTLTITTRQVSGSEIGETHAPDHGTLIPTSGTKSVREWVELIVTDTGVGMPPEVQARVFEPFFTTKGVKGTGLGLSMVHGIISRHEGEITVQSTVGQGTTFTLRLLVARAIAEVVPSPLGSLSSPDSLTLLVIDDEPLLAETLGELLGALGHTAAIVTSGEEGLTRLAVERFDLVLTDLGMPGMSGWEVAQAVKTRWPQCPVILVTGWGDAVEQARLEGTGVDAVLGKPYTVAQLRDALAQGVALIQQGGATDPDPDRLPPSGV